MILTVDVLPLLQHPAVCPMKTSGRNVLHSSSNTGFHYATSLRTHDRKFLPAHRTCAPTASASIEIGHPETMNEMTEETLPPLVVGCGGAGVDYLASVSAYPQPDEKIRTTDLQVQGGGNVGNALTAASRLGLRTRIFTKIADDSTGNQILKEFLEDGVDTSHAIVAKGGVSPFTYIIVDRESSTRTCIHTAGSPPLEPHEVSEEHIDALLDGCQLAYFDARLTNCTVRIAERAVERGLPVLVDAEKPREGLNELLQLADYVVTSESFPMTWTGEPTPGQSLLSLAHRLPRLRFVVMTRGARGCLALDLRHASHDSHKFEEGDVEEVLESLEGKIVGEQESGEDGGGQSTSESRQSSERGPFVHFSNSLRLVWKESGTEVNGPSKREVVGRVIVGSSFRLNRDEVVDTTGAGDAFIGGLIFGLLNGMEMTTMLQLGAVVAAAKCQALGARTGLPHKDDARLLGYMHDLSST